MAKRSNTNNLSWFNDDLHKLRSKQSKLYTKWKRSNKSIDFITYALCRRSYLACCNIAYENFLISLKISFENNPKAFWKSISLKNKELISPKILRYDAIVASGPQACSNFFADFFKSVYSTPTLVTTDYPIPIENYELSFPSIDKYNVLESTSKIKPSYKSGPDGIPSFLIKSCCSELAYPLLTLFNKSLSLGYFPLCWKNSFIIPLHKSGVKTDIANFRGIARLYAIPKHFESIFIKYLNFNWNKIISPYHHGFFTGRSTTTNLLEFTKHVYESFSNNNQLNVIYTDLSKAFDKLNHNL